MGFWRERRGAAGEVKGLTERGSPLVPLLSFKSSDVRGAGYSPLQGEPDKAEL